MRQSRKAIIGSGLIKAVEAAARKEDRLRGKMMSQHVKALNKYRRLQEKLRDVLRLFRFQRQDNKRLKRAVHYLEHLNGGITERQTARLEKVLGIPLNQTRSDNWHKVSDGVWNR